MAEQFEFIEKGIDDPNYDVRNDFEAMCEVVYTCEKCGDTFTLEEAASRFYDNTHGEDYFSCGNCGELCGDCASEKYDSIPILHL